MLKISFKAARAGAEIFLFTITSTPAVRPNQPPIQNILAALSPGVKQLEHEAVLSPLFTGETKNMWTYTSTPSYIFRGLDRC
jgi:hypothetical protein